MKVQHNSQIYRFRQFCKFCSASGVLLPDPCEKREAQYLNPDCTGWSIPLNLRSLWRSGSRLFKPRLFWSVYFTLSSVSVEIGKYNVFTWVALVDLIHSVFRICVALDVHFFHLVCLVWSVPLSSSDHTCNKEKANETVHFQTPLSLLPRETRIIVNTFLKRRIPQFSDLHEAQSAVHVQLNPRKATTTTTKSAIE